MIFSARRNALTPTVRSADRLVLPVFLQSLLFDRLGGFWFQRRADVVYNAAANEEENRNYLGTYFPRSFAESYFILSDLLKSRRFSAPLASGHEVSILSAGCGTGGDIAGAVAAILQYRPEVTSVRVTGLDVNEIALGYAEKILAAVAAETGVRITFQGIRTDLSSENSVRSALQSVSGTFDVVQSYKAAGELLPHTCSNPYFGLASALTPFLSDCGVFVLLDVCLLYKNGDRYGDWYPEILNRGMNSFVQNHGEIVTVLPLPCSCWSRECRRNCYMTKTYTVAYSQCGRGEIQSKVCFRVLARKSAVLPLADEMKEYRYDIGRDHRCGPEGNPVADAFTLTSKAA
jgi:hypothetical protein